MSSLPKWIDSIKETKSEIWTAIGPEGGWTDKEFHQAIDYGCSPVCLGDSILRTETASVVATQAMVSSLRNRTK